MRRLVYVGDSADVERIAAGCKVMPICPMDMGQSPIAGLVMLEIRRIESWTRMTELQSCILEWDLRGFTAAEIGQLRDMTPNAVAAVLHRAREKCLMYPHRGLLSTIVEVLGWGAVQELLSSK